MDGIVDRERGRGHIDSESEDNHPDEVAMDWSERVPGREGASGVRGADAYNAGMRASALAREMGAVKPTGLRRIGSKIGKFR